MPDQTRRARTRALLVTISAASIGLAACDATPSQTTRPRQSTPTSTDPAGPTPGQRPWIELAPGLRINRAARIVEFDATVAIDCHNPRSPEVYLELIACGPDTREHESLVVTTVPPSLIHAALLAIDITPGVPGDLATATDPVGDPIAVTLITPDGTATTATNWITDAPTRTQHPPQGFVFAGSRQGRPGSPIIYDADGTGVIIGLTTFGSEVIAYEQLISPAADIDEPVWIANTATVPAVDTPVRVWLTPKGVSTTKPQSADENRRGHRNR